MQTSPDLSGGDNDVMGLADVSQEHVDALCPELRAVVDDALAAGNELAETWTSFGNGVALRQPTPILTAVGGDVRARLRYNAFNDPHYWMGEIYCDDHPGWYLVVPFGSQFTMRNVDEYQLGLRPWKAPAPPRRRWWRAWTGR
jgi:hypothetical protein